MTYKTGEVPQLKDSVMGQVDAGGAVRGTVVGLREGGGILLQRRAPYAGNHKPLAITHDECASEDFSLVYRHASGAPAPQKAAAARGGKKR